MRRAYPVKSKRAHTSLDPQTLCQDGDHPVCDPSNTLRHFALSDRMRAWSGEIPMCSLMAFLRRPGHWSYDYVIQDHEYTLARSPRASYRPLRIPPTRVASYRTRRNDFSDVPAQDLEALNVEMEKLNAPDAEHERSPGQQVLRDHQWFGTQPVEKSQGCACVVS